MVVGLLVGIIVAGVVGIIFGLVTGELISAVGRIVVNVNEAALLDPS